MSQATAVVKRVLRCWLALGVLGCQPNENADDHVGARLTLESSAFTAGATIPRQHTADGDDASPPLRWSDPPAGTQSFALVCEDPDAPGGTWVHWVLYGLPPRLRALAAGVRKDALVLGGARQGKNDFHQLGYGGPSPPPGSAHRYVFRIYALDCELELGAGASRSQLADAIAGHVLASGALMGTYRR